MAHALAGGGEQIHTARPQLFGFGLREVAPLTDDDPILHPPREGIKQFTIIDGSCSQLKATEPSRLVTLHVEFEAIPPPHPVLGLTRPRPKRAVLAGARAVTHRHRRRVR